MNDNHAEKRKALDTEMIKVSVIDGFGAILFGLALHAKFAANGEPLFPILNNESVVMGMFIVGGSIMIWGATQILSISKRRRALENS